MNVNVNVNVNGAAAVNDGELRAAAPALDGLESVRSSISVRCQ